MSETTQYKPGDIANGHVLGQDGIWHPAQMSPVQPPAPKKKSVWGRWYMIAAYVFVALMIIGGLSGGGDEKADTEPASAKAGEPKAADAKADESKADEPKADEPKAAEPKAEPAKPKFDLAVDAGKLIKDYEDNELAADQRYDGKTLKVTGVVDKIDTDIWDDSKYILNLTDGSEWALLSVSVEGLSADELAKVKTGSTVTVIAEFDDGGDLGVILKDAHLV